MKHVLAIVILVLTVLAVFLAWTGVRTIDRGFDVERGVDEGARGYYLLLGALQVLGALVALFASYRFARARRMLPATTRESTAPSSIRERALANLKSAQTPRSHA